MSHDIARAIAKIESLDGKAVQHGRRGGEHTVEDLAAARRDIYASVQWPGEVAFFESPAVTDDPDCKGVAIIATRGRIVRVPINRASAAAIISELAKVLA